MSTFLLNVSSNRNFGDAIALKDLRENYLRNFVRCPPPRTTELLVLPLNIYLYIIWSPVTIKKYINYNEVKLFEKLNHANHPKITIKKIYFILIYKVYEHFIDDTVYKYTVVIKQAFL